MVFKWRNAWLLFPVSGICAFVLYGFHWYSIQSPSSSAALASQSESPAYAQNSSPPAHITDLGGRLAPNFNLTDQTGRSFSLAQLRGKTVVLSFMDPLCTELCPLVATEIKQTQSYLGRDTQHVVFLAVNVNPYHASVLDMQFFAKSHGFNTIPNWSYLTGTAAVLHHVWKDYGIYVEPTPQGESKHSEYTYVIDANGRERFLLNPSDQRASIPNWSGLLTQAVRDAISSRV